MRSLGLLMAVALACSGTSKSAKPPELGKADAGPQPPSNPLLIRNTTADFEDNPRLLSRLLSGPHGYFRFVNLQFSTLVCNRLENELRSSPAVNLHGDAHLEQYAVTDLGRGLTDFDDASRGPAALDLIRFGVSIRLAAEANGWSKHVPELLDLFFKGYEEALRDPKKRAPAPRVAGRFLGSFKENRAAAIEAATELMQPLDFPLTEIQTAIDRYAKPLMESDKSLVKGFFTIKKAGHLKIGIGSALDKKYLLLAEGPSTDPSDDVVLEIKEVRKLDKVPCLTANWTRDPFRILVGSARIAYRPFRYLGYTIHKDDTYWVHAWTDNYFQVVIGYSFKSPKEIGELVYDVGTQLGRGHPHMVATPLDAQLRTALIDELRANRVAIEREIDALAILTTEAWKQFTSSVTTGR